MSAQATIEQTAKPAENTQSRHLGLRISCWAIALALGAVQAWATRFTMNPDGISYLDIGDAYWRGDWHNAINAYWSPLYSWILGFFLKVVKPSIYWEYPLVHLVNFLIYVGALAAFEFLMVTVIRQRHPDGQNRTDAGYSFLSGDNFWLIGYAIFLSSSLILIGLMMVTPDMCVAAFVYLASALVIRMSSSQASYSLAVSLGLVLGLAYLSKAVLFPLAFVFLFVIAVAGRRAGAGWGRTRLATLVFFLVAGPFVLAISLQKHRPTFGDSGRINYEIEIQRQDWFIPPPEGAVHPVTVLAASPRTYLFSAPIAGTYPLWYDPSYWHEGVPVHFDWKLQAAALRRAINVYRIIYAGVFAQLNFTIATAILVGLSIRPFLKRLPDFWPLLLPAIAAIILYACVVVETRYVAPFVLIIWLGLFAPAFVPKPRRYGTLMSCVSAGMLCTVVLLSIVWTYATQALNGRRYSSAAEHIIRGGLAKDNLAVIGTSPDSTESAFVARLARMRIMAEVSGNEFWTAEPSVRREVLVRLAQAGAQGVIARSPSDQNGWTRLGGTDLWLQPLRVSGQQWKIAPRPM